MDVSGFSLYTLLHLLNFKSRIFFNQRIKYMCAEKKKEIGTNVLRVLQSSQDAPLELK